MKKALSIIIVIAIVLVLSGIASAATRTEEINSFMTLKSNFFRAEHNSAIRAHLESLSDSSFATATTMPYKDPTTLLIVSIFLGGSGIDRFMLGQIGLGVGKLLTAGGLGFWAVIDWFCIEDATRDYNYNLITSIN